MSAAPVKPLLRGWSHAVAAGLGAMGVGLLLAMSARDRPRQISILVYGLSLVLLFSVSAVYHIRTWSPRTRAALRRWDHANIFVFIAGTYTPVAFNVLSGPWRIGVLSGIWVLALVGVSAVAPSLRIPRWLLVLTYIGSGWIALAAMPQLAVRMGMAAILLLVLGGVLYSVGALSYALKRPRLWPGVFGYHELFHLMVIAASAAFYILIWLYVLPISRA